MFFPLVGSAGGESVIRVFGLAVDKARMVAYFTILKSKPPSILMQYFKFKTGLHACRLKGVTMATPVERPPLRAQMTEYRRPERVERLFTPPSTSWCVLCFVTHFVRYQASHIYARSQIDLYTSDLMVTTPSLCCGMKDGNEWDYTNRILAGPASSAGPGVIQAPRKS